MQIEINLLLFKINNMLVHKCCGCIDLRFGLGIWSISALIISCSQIACIKIANDSSVKSTVIVCSCVGIITSILLFFGLIQKKKNIINACWITSILEMALYGISVILLCNLCNYKWGAKCNETEERNGYISICIGIYFFCKFVLSYYSFTCITSYYKQMDYHEITKGEENDGFMQESIDIDLNLNMGRKKSCASFPR